jgi:hypothetical protein
VEEEHDREQKQIDWKGRVVLGCEMRLQEFKDGLIPKNLNLLNSFIELIDVEKIISLRFYSCFKYFPKI